MIPNGQVQFPQIPFALHPQVQQSSHPEPKNPPNLPDSSFLKAFKTLHTTEIKSGLYIISTRSGSLCYPFWLGFNYSLITGQGVGVGVEWREAGDLETHMRHFKTCPFLGLPYFSPGGPEGPRRKSLTGIKANGDERRAGKPDGVVGSLATPFSETSNDDDDTAGKGPGRGKARSRLLCSLRAPPATKPSPPSRLDPGVGRRRLPGDGASHGWA